MATDALKKKLQEEATCSICLEYYSDPVVLDCGHNFCRNCIDRCWKEFPTNTACPQCRTSVPTKSCRPNRPLANVVAILKQLNNPGQEESEGGACKGHMETCEAVFCKEDQVSMCLACEGSEQHRGHHLVPLKEAAQEFKDRFRSAVEILKEEKKEILTHKISAIQESEGLMKCTETEKQKTMTEFRQMHYFLADQENFLLAQIQAVARDVVKKRNEHLGKLSAELFTIQNTIRQLEEKCLQPKEELVQDAEKILEKCKQRPKFKPPEAVPPELKWRIWELQDLNVLLEGAAKQFKDLLQDGRRLQKVDLTLDPESAHPQVLVSGDGKSLRWTETEREVSKSRKRFEKRFCAMGSQEFTRGRLFWDVAVGSEEEWALGVALSSVKRKGLFPLTADEGIFAVGKVAQQYRPLSVPHPPPLQVTEEVRKIRVALNCAGGQVAFYDAEKAHKLFAFTKAFFLRETLQPFFWLKGEAAQLSLST